MSRVIRILLYGDARTNLGGFRTDIKILDSIDCTTELDDYWNGKIGWVATLTAAICLSIGFVLVFKRIHNVISKACKSNMLRDNRKRGHLLATLLLMIVSVLVVAGLFVLYDPCFNDTTPQRSAWIITTSILLQIYIIAPVLKFHKNKDIVPDEIKPVAYPQSGRQTV